MRHFIDGIEISPRDKEAIGVVSDFSERPDELSLNVESLTLPNEGYVVVMNHINTQGIFEGIPYTIVLNNGSIIEYYIDLTDPSTTFRDQEVVVKIKRRYARDNFFERANATTFTLMKSKGVVFDVFDVPYVIVPDNQAEIALSAGITLYIMTKELVQNIQSLSQLVAAFVAATVGLSGSTAGLILSLAIQTAAQLIYTIAILVAVIKLGQTLLELVFPKIRYLLACRIKELMLKGAQYLGYSFASSLLDQLIGASLLPVPLQKQSKKWFQFLQNELNQSFNMGIPTANDSVVTLGDLFRECEIMFNARTRVVNGQVVFERRDFWQNISTAMIKPALVLQDRRSDEFVLNVEESWRRYYISYAEDFNDLHVIDNFEGIDAEYVTDPVSVINQDLVMIKGLNEIQIPFALAARKESLTWAEKIVKALLKFVDNVTGVFGGGTSYEQQISNRIGVMQISQQYFGVTKFMYLVNGKQPSNYLEFIGAAALWKKYHFINQIQLNDYKIKEDARVRISETDFVTLLDNNYAEVDGVEIEILRLEYIDENSFAKIKYKERFPYSAGKVETIIINE